MDVLSCSTFLAMWHFVIHVFCTLMRRHQGQFRVQYLTRGNFTMYRDRPFIPWTSLLPLSDTRARGDPQSPNYPAPPACRPPFVSACVHSLRSSDGSVLSLNLISAAPPLPPPLHKHPSHTRPGAFGPYNESHPDAPCSSAQTQIKTTHQTL